MPADMLKEHWRCTCCYQACWLSSKATVSDQVAALAALAVHIQLSSLQVTVSPEQGCVCRRSILQRRLCTSCWHHMLFSIPLVAQQRLLMSLQALMASGEAARATLALRVLLDEHKSVATTLLLLTKALLQTGSTVAVQDAVIMARWAAGSSCSY